ncbi:hypothetical protein AB1Y20_007408 [Prymnesium parvum]|uniref:Uncharacterized protein n=1 Tax=Prymnesium parvum TaxID=97485 RepID=A0AB34IXW5_PRYPA
MRQDEEEYALDFNADWGGTDVASAAGVRQEKTGNRGKGGANDGANASRGRKTSEESLSRRAKRSQGQHASAGESTTEAVSRRAARSAEKRRDNLGESKEDARGRGDAAGTSDEDEEYALDFNEDWGDTDVASAAGSGREVTGHRGKGGADDGANVSRGSKGAEESLSRRAKRSQGQQALAGESATGAVSRRAARGAENRRDNLGESKADTRGRGGAAEASDDEAYALDFDADWGSADAESAPRVSSGRPGSSSTEWDSGKDNMSVFKAGSSFSQAARLVAETKAKVDGLREKVAGLKGKAYAQDRSELNREIRELEEADEYIEALKVVAASPGSMASLSGGGNDSTREEKADIGRRRRGGREEQSIVSDSKAIEAARVVAETKAKVDALREKVAGMKGKAYAQDRSELNREIRELEEADVYIDALKVVAANPGAASTPTTSMEGSGTSILKVEQKRAPEAARVVAETKAKIDALREKVAGMKGKAYAQDRSELNREIRELEEADEYLDALKVVAANPGAVSTPSARNGASPRAQDGSFGSRPRDAREETVASNSAASTAARVVAETKAKIDALREKVAGMKGKAYAQDRSELNREIRELEEADEYIEALKVVAANPGDVSTPTARNGAASRAAEESFGRRRRGGREESVASEPAASTAGRVVAETKAKIDELREKVAGMKGKAYAQDRSELNREIRELEESDEYIEALKVVAANPGVMAKPSARNGAAAMAGEESFGRRRDEREQPVASDSSVSAAGRVVAETKAKIDELREKVAGMKGKAYAQDRSELNREIRELEEADEYIEALKVVAANPVHVAAANARGGVEGIAEEEGSRRRRRVGKEDSAASNSAASTAAHVVAETKAKIDALREKVAGMKGKAYAQDRSELNREIRELEEADEYIDALKVVAANSGTVLTPTTRDVASARTEEEGSTLRRRGEREESAASESAASTAARIVAETKAKIDELREEVAGMKGKAYAQDRSELNREIRELEEADEYIEALKVVAANPGAVSTPSAREGGEGNVEQESFRRRRRGGQEDSASSNSAASTAAHMVAETKAKIDALREKVAGLKGKAYAQDRSELNREIRELEEADEYIEALKVVAADPGAVLTPTARDGASAGTEIESSSLRRRGGREESVASGSGASTAARVVAETKAKIDELREKVAGMKGKVYAQDRSELNREIRELEEADEYIDALKVVAANPGTVAAANTREGGEGNVERESSHRRRRGGKEESAASNSAASTAGRVVAETKAKIDELREKVAGLKGKAYAQDRSELNREIRELEEADEYIEALKVVAANPGDVSTPTARDGASAGTEEESSSLRRRGEREESVASDSAASTAARVVAETKAKIDELREKVAGLKGKAYAQDRSELNREIRELEQADEYIEALKVVAANPGAVATPAAHDGASAKAEEVSVDSRRRSEREESVASDSAASTAARVVAETKAKVDQLREKVADLKGKAYAQDRSELNREIRELEESDVFLDALRVVNSNPKTDIAPATDVLLSSGTTSTGANKESSEAARIVAETKAKIDELREKVAGMKGKAYAQDRSELNREIRELEQADEYIDALKVVEANLGAVATRTVLEDQPVRSDQTGFERQRGDGTETQASSDSKAPEAARVVAETKAKVIALREKVAGMKGKAYAQDRSELNREIRELEEADEYIEALKLVETNTGATIAPESSMLGSSSLIPSVSDNKVLEAARMVAETKARVMGLREKVAGMKGKAYAQDRSELNREIRTLEEADEYIDALKVLEANREIAGRSAESANIVGTQMSEAAIVPSDSAADTHDALEPKVEKKVSATDHEIRTLDDPSEDPHSKRSHKEIVPSSGSAQLVRQERPAQERLHYRVVPRLRVKLDGSARVALTLKVKVDRFAIPDTEDEIATKSVLQTPVAPDAIAEPARSLNVNEDSPDASDVEDDLAIVVEIHRLDMAPETAESLSVRRLQLEVDVLGLQSHSGSQLHLGSPSASPYKKSAAFASPYLSTHNRTETISLRSLAVRGTAHLFFQLKTPLARGSKSRRVVREALRSATTEDSDIYIVLHGLGGAETGASQELATGIVNLEELEQLDRNLHMAWIRLVPDGETQALGEVQVSVSCLRALKLIRRELDEGYVDEPEEQDIFTNDNLEQAASQPPWSETPDSWKLGINVFFVELSSLPERVTCYMLHVDVNGSSFQSRSCRCSPGWTQQQLVLPLKIDRDVYCGPGTADFPEFRRVACTLGQKLNSDQGSLPADGLIIRLVELHEGRWFVRATSQFDVRQLLSMPPDDIDGSLEDTIGAVVAHFKMRLHTSTLIRALQSYQAPSPASQLPSTSTTNDAEELNLRVEGIQLLPSAPTLPRGSRGVLEVQLGSGSVMLHAPLTSRIFLIPAPGQRSVSKMEWNKSLRVPRHGILWHALSNALDASGDEHSNLSFSLLVCSTSRAVPSWKDGSAHAVGASTSTRTLIGTGTWNLRRQLLSGRDAVQERSSLLDGRGVPVAVVWFTMAANAALEAIASDSHAQLPLPPLASRKRAADVLVQVSLCVARLQAGVRGLLQRKHLRMERGEFAQTMRVCIHKLVLPPELCFPEKVSAAAVQVELAGVLLIKKDNLEGGAMRPRAGNEVVFETERTLPVERGSIPFGIIREGLRFGANKCCLKVTVAAERLIRGKASAALQLFTEQRFSLGEVLLDLRELLRTGSDLLEHPFSLHTKAKSTSAALGANVVITLEAVEALASLQKLFKLPSDQPSGGLKSTVVLKRLRLKSVLILQAYARGFVARTRRKIKTNVHGIDLEEMRISISELRMTNADAGGLPQLMPGQMLRLELALDELTSASGSDHPAPSLGRDDAPNFKADATSDWFALPEGLQPAAEEYLSDAIDADAAPPRVPLSIELRVSMRHGGHARGVLRDALYRNQLTRGTVEVRLVARTEDASEQTWFEPTGARDVHRSAFWMDDPPFATERTLATASLPILSLTPTSDLEEAAAPSLPLTTPTGAVLGDVHLEVTGVQVLRRLHIANRLRLKDDELSSPPEASPAAWRRGARTNDEGESIYDKPDVVDQFRDKIISAAIAQCEQAGKLDLAAFFCNPGLTELTLLWPRLSSARELRLAFCLSFRDASVLTQTLAATSRLLLLDLSSCDVQDDGATVVASILREAQCELHTVILRANRIRVRGAAALGRALSLNQTLTLLDLSANHLKDAGASALCSGSDPDAAESVLFEPIEAEEPLSRRERRRSTGTGESAPVRRARRRSMGQEVVGGLERNSGLRTLLLSINSLTYRSFEPLAGALTGHASLTELDLSVNRLEGDEGMNSVRDAPNDRPNAVGRSTPQLSSDAKWRWPQALESFGSFLASIPNLARLKVQHCGERAMVGAFLGTAMEIGAAPLEVNMQGCPLSAAACGALLRGLKARGAGGPSLLNLEGCLKHSELHRQELWATLLGDHASARRLNLGFNGIEDGGGVDALCAALAKNTTLRTLDLGSNPLSLGTVGALCDALSTQAGLEGLNLSNTMIGSSGAARLAQWLLGGACGLTSLELDGCGLGADGAAVLKDVLAKPSKAAPLRRLRLEYNQLCEGGAAELAKGLAVNPVLTALYIGTNMLGEGGARAISKALALNSSLQTLDIGDNAIGPAGFRMILEAARAQRVLTALDASDNELGDEGAEALARDLMLSAFRFVRLAGNGIQGPGGRSLAGSLSSSDELLFLDATRNSSMEYQDSVRIKLHNNLHINQQHDNPLDTMGSADDYAS